MITSPVRPFVVALALVLTAVVVPAGTAQALGQTFTVTSAGDDGDVNAGDGACATGAGACTLRAALQEANATAGLDTVAFSVGTGVVTIQPGSALPPITDPVVIDGTTQPGYSEPYGNPLPVVQIDGAAAGAGVDGVRVTGGGSTLSGLVIGGFGGSGVLIQGASGTTVVNSHIGTDPAGTAANPNAHGVTVDGSKNNQIGVSRFGWSNVISGNGSGTAPDTGFGVRILGAASSGNVVTDNMVGEKRPGHGEVLDRLPNRGGILVDGAPANTIGVGEGANFLLGNIGSGVLIRGAAARGNVVSGNCLGCGHQTADVNTGFDIDIDGAPANTVRGNRIDFGAPDGQIRVHGPTADGNAVLGNEVHGSAGKLFNPPAAVHVDGAPNTTIGGAGTGEGNGVSYGGPCISVVGAGSTGSSVVGNGGYRCRTAGVSVATDGVPIRGNTFTESDVGIDVVGTGVVVQGNRVLTSGQDLRYGPGFGIGIRVDGADGVIGGAAPGDGNQVSGTLGDGIAVGGPRALILGNRIGTNAAGTQQFHTQIPSDDLSTPPRDVYGNYGDGIVVDGPDTVIGGTTAGDACAGSCNLISGNNGDGVRTGGGAVHAVVVGNRIGTDVTGTTQLPVEPARATDNGIVVVQSAGVRIGGAAPGEGNVITGAGSGVVVYLTERVTIRGNAIRANERLGIDLIVGGGEGVTPNDPGDADTGANRLQNFPEITRAVQDSALTVAGTLNSAGSQTFTVEFFSVRDCDPSGYGEGDHPLGAAQVVTNATGTGTFTTTLPSAHAGDRFVTATATDSAGNTSEFSACFAVKGTQTIDFPVLPDRTYGDEPFAVTATASSGLPVSFSSDTPVVCTVADATVTVLGAGECTIRAAQAGDASWAPAPDVTRTFTVRKAAQTISFGPLTDLLYGADPFPVSASATSGLPVTLVSVSPEVCTVSGSVVSPVSAGLCTLEATQPGDANWSAAEPVRGSFTVGYDIDRLWPTKTDIKAGSTVPVKFRLTGADGASIPSAVAEEIGCPDVTVSFGDAEPVCAVYDAKRDLVQADIKTSSALPPGSYPVTIAVSVSRDSTTTTVASSTFTVRIVK